MGFDPGPSRAVFDSQGPPAGTEAPRTFVRFLIVRLISAVIVVFLVLTLVFITMEVLPGDPTRVFLPRGGCTGTDPSCALGNQLIHQWGLDRPVLDRYALFLSNVFQGNLGTSFTYRMGTPVSDLIAAALPPTLALTGVTLLGVILLGLALGVPLSRRKGRAADSVVSLLLAIPFAAPVFVLGLGMLELFAVVIPVFPLYGAHSIGYTSLDPVAQFADLLWHLALPTLILILAEVGLFVWIVRDYPLRPPEATVAPGDWRAPTPGLRKRLGATVPRFLPAIPALLGWTFASVFTVEALSGTGGLGTLLWTATLDLDYPLVMGIAIVGALLLILPALVAADIIDYRFTAHWARADGLHVAQFRVELRDLRRGFMRILTHPLGFLGIVIALVLVVMTLAAPLLVGPFPSPTVAVQPNLPPSPEHPLGTNYRGLDVLTLTVYGGQTGVIVAIAAFAFALIAELGVTAAIGFFGDRADVFLGIPVDLFLVLPLPFLLLMGMVQYVVSFVLFAALIAWPIPVRILRMELARLVPRETGAGRPKLSLTARGRRTLDLIWGAGPLLLGDALLAVALALSLWGVLGLFGFHVTGATSWGEIINDWYDSLGLVRGTWEGYLAPALGLIGAVLAPTLVALACKSIGPRPKPAELQPLPAPAVSSVPPVSSQP